MFHVVAVVQIEPFEILEGQSNPDPLTRQYQHGIVQFRVYDSCFELPSGPIVNVSSVNHHKLQSMYMHRVGHHGVVKEFPYLGRAQ